MSDKVSSNKDPLFDDPFYRILSDELRFRRLKNKKYSIRAFALFLDVDQSLLSRFLRQGTASISRASKQKCLRRLGYKQSDIKDILTGPQEGQDYLKVDSDVFKFMTEWYYFAVLELMKIKGFDPTPVNISERLAVPVGKVKEAIRILLKFNFICKNEDGHLMLSRPNNSWSSASKTDEARKLYQKRILKKSTEALLNVDISERQHLSMTIAIDRRRLPEFKNKLHLMQRELTDSFQAEGEYDDVYQLVVNFFPLTARTKR